MYTNNNPPWFFKAKLSFIFLLYRGTTMRSEMKKSSKASGLKSEDKCLGLWFNYQKKREREKCSTTNCWECIGIAESHKFHSQVRRNACCLSKHSSLSIMKAESLVQSSSSHSLYSTMIRLEGSIFNPSIVMLLTSWFISNAVIVLSLYSTWLTIYLWWSGTCIYGELLQLCSRTYNAGNPISVLLLDISILF